MDQDDRDSLLRNEIITGQYCLNDTETDNSGVSIEILPKSVASKEYSEELRVDTINYYTRTIVDVPTVEVTESSALRIVVNNEALRNCMVTAKNIAKQAIIIHDNDKGQQQLVEKLPNNGVTLRFDGKECNYFSYI